jgi:hypothetical protein
MNKIINSYFSFPSQVKEIVNVIPDNDPLLVSSTAATEFVDTVNPVCDETGMRRNDIDVAMTCKDPTLRNTLLGGLAKDVDPLAVDNTGLTDDEIATQAIPRNTHISDIIDAGNAVNDYIANANESQPVNESQSAEPVTTPVAPVTSEPQTE